MDGAVAPRPRPRLPAAWGGEGRRGAAAGVAGSRGSRCEMGEGVCFGGRPYVGGGALDGSGFVLFAGYAEDGLCPAVDDLAGVAAFGGGVHNRLVPAGRAEADRIHGVPIMIRRSIEYNLKKGS